MSRYRVKNMHIIMVIFATILIIQSYAIAESSEYIDTCNFIQNYQYSEDTIDVLYIFIVFVYKNV